MRIDSRQKENTTDRRRKTKKRASRNGPPFRKAVIDRTVPLFSMAKRAIATGFFQ
jgi:hypothetical protein